MSQSIPQGHTQEWQHAIARYHQLVAEQPHDVRLLTNLAWSYERAGEYTQAVEHFKKALTLDQDYTDASYGLGLALLRNGQRQEALQALERAHALAGASEHRGFTVIVQHHCRVLIRSNSPA